MTVLIDINPTAGYVTAGDGKFDTRKRYLRHGTASDDFSICKDRTFVTVVSGIGGTAIGMLNWRFSVGSTVFTRAHTDGGSGAISYDPAFTLVRL